jgi:hypothetical protein
MNVRVCRVLYAAIAALLFFHASALAQVENAIMMVKVTDRQTGKPIDNAQVFLLGGDTPQSSLTDAQGLLIFENIPPGLYRIQVEISGYQKTEMTDVDVISGQRVNVAVQLVPALRTIAAITSRSSVSVTTEDVSAESGQRKISSSLSDALNKLAGVNVDDELYGANSAFNVSLRNNDPSQTAYSIDGIRISGAGSQGMGAFQDLFSGASVSFAPGALGSAGMVSFFTLQPTKTWSYGFDGAVGGYGLTTGSWTITGGAGRIALAAQHTAYGKNQPLNGSYYEDQTGSAYEHLGGYSRNANLLKANATISPASNLKLTYMDGFGRSSYICSNDTTVLPCGSGPGNYSDNRNTLLATTFESLAGHVQYDLNFNTGAYSSDAGQPNRAVNGVLSPYYSSQKYTFATVVGYAKLTQGRHDVTAGYWEDVQGGTGSSTFNAMTTQQANRVAHVTDSWIGNHVKSSEKIAFTYGVDLASGTDAGSSLEANTGITWQPSRSDTLDLSTGFGSAEPSDTFVSPLGDALSAQYDCQNGSVYVSGPSDQASHQSSQTYNLAWRHTFRGGFINAQTYSQIFGGQMLYSAVPIASEPASIFSGGSLTGYLQQVSAVWQEPAVCGSTPFDPSRVYVNQATSGLTRISQGITINGRMPLGKNVMAFPTYAVASTYLSTLDPRFMADGSYYAVGAQLPHRPLHTAGITIDGVLSHSGLEWLLNGQFTSANNGNNLPGYTTYSAGMLFHARIGTLTVLESNIFGTHTGLFTTYQGVNPMPVQGGGYFAFATTPLPPRQITVEYRVTWHEHQSPATPAPKKAIK